MAGNAQDYQALAIRLLPLGRVWDLTRALKSELAQILLATSDSAARIDAKFSQVLVEMDPRTAHDANDAEGGLLRDWEALYALDRGALSVADRQTQLHARMLAIGGGSRPQFLIDQAALSPGTPTVTLAEMRSFRCKDNCHSVRDTLIGGGTTDGGHPIGLGHKWNWVFAVHAPAALDSDQRTALETLFATLTHARSLPLFVYDL